MSNTPAWLDIVLCAATVLAAGTAFVSALSAESTRRRADKTQAEALLAWQSSAQAQKESNELLSRYRDDQKSFRSRATRADHARALSTMANMILMARQNGMAQEDVRLLIVDNIEDVHDTQMASDEPTRMKFGRWALAYSELVPLPDEEAVRTAVALTAGRTRRWIDEPGQVMTEIRAEPGFDFPTPISVEDDKDFRVA